MQSDDAIVKKILASPEYKEKYEKKLETPVQKWNAWISAFFLLGAASGGLIFGWLGDKIGRITSMSLSILTYSIFTGSVFFAQEPWHVATFRFAAAIGMGGEWSLGIALVVECWPEKFRPILSGVIGAAANVGFLIIAGIGVLYKPTIDTWRWMPLIGILPAIMAFFVFKHVPESERWKAAVSKSASRPLHELFSSKYIYNTLIAIVLATVPLLVTWGAVSSSLPPWAANLAKGTKWAGSAASWSQIMISIGAITGCIIAPVVGGKVGRRPVYFALCLLALIVCGYQFSFFERISPAFSMRQFDAMFLFTNVLAGLTTAAFYGWMPLYLPELFPTRIRATGQGFSFNFGRIMAAVGVLYMGQITPLFKGDWGLMGSTFALIYLLGMVVIWFAPETKGKPLPE
ncbi:MAG: MFS transporter [Candidatus Sumerlaeota bacterium]|nr:MFS transporter [Candidatus Sumerlaeota bacterium]